MPASVSPHQFPVLDVRVELNAGYITLVFLVPMLKNPMKYASKQSLWLGLLFPIPGGMSSVWVWPPKYQG